MRKDHNETLLHGERFRRLHLAQYGLEDKVQVVAEYVGRVPDQRGDQLADVLATGVARLWVKHVVEDKDDVVEGSLAERGGQLGGKWDLFGVAKEGGDEVQSGG